MRHAHATKSSCRHKDLRFGKIKQCIKTKKKGEHFFCVQLAPSVRSFLTMLSNVPGTSFGLIFLLAAVDES